MPRGQSPIIQQGELAELEAIFQSLDRAAISGQAIRLPVALISRFIRHDRQNRGWKQETLASFANVSLSTIQRIERSQPIRLAQLERIEQALGHTRGTYSEKRIPLSIAETKKIFAEKKNYETKVSIRPLRTIPQVAALTRCKIGLVNDTGVEESAKASIAEFKYLIDSAGLVIAAQGARMLSRSEEKTIQKRDIYRSILEKIREIEITHCLSVVGGTYEARTNWSAMPHVKAAVLGFYPRGSEPGANKIKVATAPAVIDMDHLWSRFVDEMDQKVRYGRA